MGGRNHDVGVDCFSPKTSATLADIVRKLSQTALIGTGLTAEMPNLWPLIRE